MEEEKKYIALEALREDFSNKTLSYRIHGFSVACDMEADVKVFNNSGVIFSSAGLSSYNRDKKSDEPAYFIAVSDTKNNNHGSGVTISGNYSDLSFSFTNYYAKEDYEKLDKKIREIPFDIILSKTIEYEKAGNEAYELKISTIQGIWTKFTINKSYEFKNKTISANEEFYANVLDFEDILKLVKAFVFNPKLFFMTYNEEVRKKKIVLSTPALKKGIMQDEKLDKPAEKIMKKI